MVFWVEHVTICRSIGYSLYFMVHSVKARLPFDIAEATYLLPPITNPLFTTKLIAYCACQLQKRPEDLKDMVTRIREAHQKSLAQFIKNHATTIRDYSFQISNLVLVCNSKVEMEIGRQNHNITDP